MNSLRNERKMETGQELRDSELRYRRLFEAAQDGILILDARTGAIDDVNPYLIEMLGYSREEFVQKKLWEVGAFKDIEASKDAFERLQEEDYIRYHDLPLKAKDGRLVQVEFVSNVYKVGDKEVIQCNIRDTTQSMLARRALAASDDKLRALVAGMTDVVVVYDADGRYVEIGPTNPINLARPAGEMLGKTVNEFFPPDEARFLLEHIRKVLKTGEPSDVDYSLQLGGQVEWFSAKVSPFAADTVLWVANNITQRKRAEEALKNSETRFRSLIENGLDNISLLGADGTLLWESPSVIRTLGYRPDEFIGGSMFDLLHPDDAEMVQVLLGTLRQEPGGRQSGTFRIRHRDGTWRWMEAVATNMLQEPSVNAIVVNYHDVTERTLAGESLKESEEHFRSLFENMLDGYAHCRMLYEDGRPSDFVYLHVNPVFETLTGLKNVAGKKVSELIPGIREANPELFELYGKAASTGVPGKIETYVGGLKIWFSISVYSPRSGEFVAVFDNITQRKQAETLQAAVYRIAVAADKTTGLDALYPQIHEIISSVMPAENFYIALYDEEQNKLRFPYSRDVADDSFPDELAPGKGLTAYVLRTGRSLLCTQALHDELEQQGEVQLVGVPSAIWLGVPLIVGQKTIGALVVQHYSDPQAYGEREQHMLEFVSTQVAIAISRKQAEEQLRYDAVLLANVNDAIIASDAGYRLTAWNAAAEAQYGWKAEEVLGKNGLEIVRTEWPGVDADEMRRTIAETGHWRGEATQARKDGTRIPVEASSVVLRDEDGQITGYVSAILDITKRKQAAEELVNERNLLRTLIDNIPDAIYAKDIEGRFILKNLADARRMGAASTEETIGKTDFDYYSPELAAQYDADDQSVIHSGEAIIDREEPIADATGRSGWVLTTKLPLQDYEGKVIGLVGIGHDITERKRAEAKIREQIEHLTALSEIDRAISSSYDLNFVLFKLLAHVTGQLGVDATDILLLNTTSDLLEYAVGVGFRTSEFEHASLRMGQSYAGTAALERQIVQAFDLLRRKTGFLGATGFKAEGFDSYIGVPMVMKGKLLGVLEIFQRGPLEPVPEWLDFLNTLAGQAAIAIDNAGMLEHLERSNTRLAMAYNATLEGWSRALDLRDKDTEGHTQRVTALCIKLARNHGLSAAELENLRRGALLHDIGKMGVPDSILLKPGPLTDEEWVIMKRHPAVAYDLISPIEFLRPALDIPYCHHEKWDGTGYPRGLKGEEIPIAARIFAVVDVWDALTSDRPYRTAWSGDKALAYIQEQSGKQFDPKVVKIFLRQSLD